MIAALVAGFLCVGAFSRASTLEPAELIAMGLVAALATAAAAMAWVRLGQLNKEAKAQRAVYYDHTGLFADPALLPAEVKARGPEKQRLASAHQAIWERVKALDPEALHVEKYGF